ncbi:MAG: transcriptional repressor [Lachnospiraceae bacterium]
MMKYSRQREAIKEYLAKQKYHPTADDIYMNLREQYPKLSLGTVYRNLNLLTEQGEISRITTQDVDHFDFNTSFHHHFICNRCKRVYDISVHTLPVLDQSTEYEVGQVEGYMLSFYGICNQCLKEPWDTRG